MIKKTPHPDTITVEFQGIPVDNYFHRIGDSNYKIHSNSGNYHLQIINGKSSMNEEELKEYSLGNYKTV